ncbi:hypothetical protein MNBD_BACTEROID06-1007 [hydrothermal vent metagenome]|uniref:Uncharacterized protein n=1 Tax=hydrothermal vent metagenome TaxID=652676 RepID=A0A3B0U7R0_9ZZZZ
MSMKVTVEKIEPKTIDNNVFNIPKGYHEMPESMKTLLKNQ